MRQFEINFGETALLNFVPAVRIGIGVESDLIKAFTMAETGFKLLEQGDMDAGTKLLLPYVRAIHRNAFGYDAPPSTLLAIMGAYEFDRLKQILGNFRSGLEVAEAFYIDDNNTIYMPTMEDLETTLSVVFHEMGHAKDNVEFNKSSNEFTSEAIGFYLDLVSCRNRIGTSGGADTIEGEIYLDNDGMPLLLKPDVCRRIPEEILKAGFHSWS